MDVSSYKNKMNSKSVDTRKIVVDHLTEHKSFEFVKLYKSADETNAQLKTSAPLQKIKKLNKSSKTELNTSKRLRPLNKRKGKKDNEILESLNLEADKHSSSESAKSRRKSRLTSPDNKDEHVNKNGVKSIMKNNCSDIDSLLNASNISTSSSKPKKRNKSVSFMLEDAEDIVLKKSKSKDSSTRHESEEKENKDSLVHDKTKAAKKQKKKLKTKQAIQFNRDTTTLKNKNNVTDKTKVKNNVTESTSDIPGSEDRASVEAKKGKKVKNTNGLTVKSDVIEDNITGEQSSEGKSKKNKKNKRKVKSLDEGNIVSEGEPANKTRKKDLKPEVIAKGLENLNIGDNAYTLTNLLDEMTVVDQNAKKKQKKSKQKNMKSKDSPEDVPRQESSFAEGSVKEKVKWNKRKWNKGSKLSFRPRLQTSVVVENLPLKIMCTYKTLISEHFSKFGTIAGIGVAEAYPTEDLKPVFTTTVFFQNNDAAAKALEEDNTEFQGSRIRVRRPRPPTETTLVVRAYGMTDQALSSLFSGAGRVRAIQLLVKGKKSMPTAFVEFDGPEAVEKALKLAEDVKINGKNIYVCKFKTNNENKLARSENDSNNAKEDSSDE